MMTKNETKNEKILQGGTAYDGQALERAINDRYYPWDKIINSVMLENEARIQAQAERWNSDRDLEDEMATLERAKKKVLETAFTRQCVKELMNEGKSPIPLRLPETKRMMEEQVESFTTKSPFVLLTINPREGISLLEFKLCFEKFVKKKWIKTYFYVFEIRKSPNHGLHAHCILEYTGRPFDMKKSVKKYFNKVCDSNNHNICNVKYIPEAIIEDKLKYLLGQKKESKMSGVAATRAYRQANNLQAYYESNPPFTCRVANTTPLIEEVV